VSIAANAAASVVWLTTGAEPGVRVSALSCALSALADTRVDLAVTLGSGFLVGTGAFDVTTTSFMMVKDKVFVTLHHLAGNNLLPR
jgi:hypothetical protein